jgi:hypothetical protein
MKMQKQDLPINKHPAKMMCNFSDPPASKAGATNQQQV